MTIIFTKKDRSMCIRSNISLASKWFAAVFILAFILISHAGANAADKTKTLVFFHDESSAHSIKLQPVWENFTVSCKTDMTLIKISRNSSEGDKWLKKYDVQGFPTIMLLDASNKKVDEFEGPRTKRALCKYVQQNG
jgi:thioredoxin-like negative regulator of GroEL